MWGILVIQIVIEVVGKSPGHSISDFIFIVGSTLICMFLSLISIVKNIGEYRTKLLNKVQDYVINTYPTEKANKSKSKDIQELLDKIDKIELKTDVLETIKENKESNKKVLKETDIRDFLNSLEK